MHQRVVLKNNIKIYVKIYIKTAPTCFGVTTAEQYNIQTPIFSNTTTVLTTNRCILMDYFNNCNFSKHKLMRYLTMVLTVTPKMSELF